MEKRLEKLHVVNSMRKQVHFMGDRNKKPESAFCISCSQYFFPLFKIQGLDLDMDRFEPVDHLEGVGKREYFRVSLTQVSAMYSHATSQPASYGGTKIRK